MQLPDDRWVRWLIAPAIVFVALATNDAYLVDYWHHVARGREMARTGERVDVDRFTYTVGDAAFVDVNWLTQLVYWRLHAWGGLGAVRTMNAGVAALTWLWLVALVRRESRSLEVAAALGLALFVGTWQVLTIRPQTFSLLLFVGLLDLLHRAERDARWLWAAPAFLALWANLHGAFPAGLILVGTFALARRQAPWAAAALGCAVATLANPYGARIYAYVGGTSNASAARGIDEWLPPSWDQGIGVAFFVSLPLIAGVLALAWRRGRRTSLREALLLVAFGLLAARSVRMVPWWLIVAGPIVGARLPALASGLRAVRYAPSVGALASVVFLTGVSVLSFPSLQAYHPLLAMRTPTRTTDDLAAADAFLAETLGRGRVFAKLEWGEYLGWAGAPDRKVFIDGRIEIVSDAVWADYSRVTLGQTGWDAILVRTGTDALVLDADFHARTGLLAAVDACEAWRLAKTFGEVRVYLRANGTAIAP